MLLQTLLTVSIVVLFAGALLTSALVSAKATLHATATRAVSSALGRGTNDVRAWAANFVARNHARAHWPVSVRISDPEPVCDSCSLRVSLAYRVTGSTTAPTTGSEGGSGLGTAENLQTLVDEQRVAVEVTATVSNTAGVVLGKGTRELTLRVFDAAPWAVVTGARDLSTVLGSVHAAEGDTGGAAPSPGGTAAPAAPDPRDPSAYKNTTIGVMMTCANSTANNDQSAPFADNQPPGNNSMPWGVQARGRAFEAPCSPSYAITLVPSDADVPKDGNYRVGSFRPAQSWSNGSRTAPSGWPQ